MEVFGDARVEGIDVDQEFGVPPDVPNDEVSEHDSEVDVDERSVERDEILEQMRRDREEIEVKYSALLEENSERMLGRVRESYRTPLVERTGEPHSGGGGDNHDGDVSSMMRDMMRMMGRLSDRVEAVENGSRGGKGRDGRRETIVVNGRTLDYSSVPKSIRDPPVTVKFGGNPREDVDAFVRTFKQQTELTDPVFLTARLFSCLGEIPALAFRQHFNTKPTDVPFDRAIAFLFKRYRKHTHQHDLLRRVLEYSQKASAESYFSLVEEQLAIVGIDPNRCDPQFGQLLIAMLAKGLKSEVYRRLRESHNNFGTTYAYNKFKADCIAIDNALHSTTNFVKRGDNLRAGQRVAQILGEEVEEPEYDRESVSSGAYSDKERDELRAMLLKFEKKRGKERKSGGSSARQPAYKFPLDYKSDSICRYCKSSSHIAPLCNSLYKNRNHGSEMPVALKESVEAQLKQL